MQFGGCKVDVAVAQHIRVGNGGGETVTNESGAEGGGITESVERACGAADLEETLVGIVQSGKIHGGTESGGAVVGSTHTTLYVQLLYFLAEVGQVDKPRALRFGIVKGYTVDSRFNSGSRYLDL